ncbi:hypothetical protein [Methanococcoides methylutens]|uniref:hypothetical protein n=1 Tax=Methanococcoides methylutens TaxID=2226 RepID=UPI0012E07041|nr:hypothetical protein [Methanococcoides methylutens]
MELYVDDDATFANTIESLTVEMIGAVLAFLLFTVLFEIHDIKKMEGIKRIAFRELGKDIRLSFLYIRMLCDIQQDAAVKQNVRLLYLSKAKNITFSDFGNLYLLGKLRKKDLNTEKCYNFLESYTKYQMVIEPNILEILWDIERNLNHLFQINYLMITDSDSENVILERKKVCIASIISNLYKLQAEYKIPIFPKDDW